MGYATHIGRVGGLAVALGVGMGLATATAYADPLDSPAGAEATASTATAPAATASAPRGQAAKRVPAAAAAKGVPSAAASKARVNSRAAAAATARATVSAARQASETAAVAPSVAAADVAPAVQSAAPAVAATSITVHRAASVVSAQSQAQPQALAQASAQAQAPQDPVQAVVHAVTQVAAQFVNAVLSPLLINGPLNDPSQAPALWSMLAWARRELGQSLTGATASVTTTGLSENLLANGGAEFGDPSESGNSAVSIPGWTLTGTPTVIGYNTPRNSWPMGSASANPDLPAFMGFPTGTAGDQFFGGGNVATSTLTQIVDLGDTYNATGQTFSLSGQLGGWLINPGKASIQVDFLDSNKGYLGSASVGPVTMFDRWFQTKLLDRSTTGTLPTGTQYAQVTVTLKAWNPIFPGLNADYNSAFADNISFQVSGLDTPTPDPVVPVSNVGALDHVFMVYMENKGYDDIVGSANAPYLNSLINAYGFADNYYGLTHGSLPNYYPIVAGQDFGITYNCAAPCIDVSLDNTLVGRVDDKFGGTTSGTSWRSYAQSLSGDPLVSGNGYAVDETPFPAFTAIANNPAYAAEHIVPLEQMAIDLQSTTTTPKFAWFAADEDFNGEGPVSFPWGMLNFAWSQISPGHQYNVPALDQYLSENVPTILNSASWKTTEVGCTTGTPDGCTNKSVVVITFDEDNNNLSLGFGNEGNHIVTVVIPNQEAIISGMRAGAFVDTTHYNHYSLLNMIETSLGLTADSPGYTGGWLTKNDQWAAPMNGFWGTNPVV